jgi:hypothetical protein
MRKLLKCWYVWLGLVLLLGLVGSVALIYSSQGPLQSYGYSVNAFSGDGQITDTGYWSYYRYHITLPKVQIAERRVYKFSFQGVPHEHFGFGLALDNMAQLRALQAVKDRLRIGVTLQDETDKIICEVSLAPLAQWIESSSQTSVQYWHKGCRDFVLDTARAYTVVLTLEVEGHNVAPIVLTPTLEGGGNETP